jgi:hypothetical protein
MQNFDALTALISDGASGSDCEMVKSLLAGEF